MLYIKEFGKFFSLEVSSIYLVERSLETHGAVPEVMLRDFLRLL
jgi:hypothetical protein